MTARVGRSAIGGGLPKWCDELTHTSHIRLERWSDRRGAGATVGRLCLNMIVSGSNLEKSLAIVLECGGAFDV